MIEILSNIFRYIKNFGFFRGVGLFLNIELFRNKKMRIRGHPAIIYYRPGTADLKVFREIFLFQTCEIRLKTLRYIIDGGAHIGFSTIYYRMMYPEAQILAVEPGNKNFRLLTLNCKRLPKVHLINAGLWKNCGPLKIMNPDDNTWAYRVQENDLGDEEELHGITIAALMEKFNIPYIDLIKLDIEGSETEVFSENYDDWIKRTRNILIELHDWYDPACSRTVFRTLSSYNFTTTVIHGMLWFRNLDNF